MANEQAPGTESAAEPERYVGLNDSVDEQGNVTAKSPEEISERVYRLFVDSGMGEPVDGKATGYRVWSGYTAPAKEPEAVAAPAAVAANKPKTVPAGTAAPTTAPTTTATITPTSGQES